MYSPVDCDDGVARVADVVKGYDHYGIGSLLSVGVVSNLADLALAAVWHGQGCAVSEQPDKLGNPLSRSGFGDYAKGISLWQGSGQLDRVKGHLQRIAQHSSWIVRGRSYYERDTR